jgi:hypothetical protein
VADTATETDADRQQRVEPNGYPEELAALARIYVIAISPAKVGAVSSARRKAHPTQHTRTLGVNEYRNTARTAATTF